MSAIVVYRTFYWTESRLAGQTGHIWETKEEQARCIKEPPDVTMLTSGVQMTPPSIPPTKDMQLADAQVHISDQICLCGIHGFFSPNYLGLQMVNAGGKAGGVDHEGEMVYTRVRLGGLVDIRSMGARAEYGLIEEAWGPKDIAEAIAKRYDIPVNQSVYEEQPRTDPQLTGDAKLVKLAPLFAGMPEAMGLQNSLGLTPGPAVGIQTVITPTMVRQARATLGNAPPMAQLSSNPISFKQYMNMMIGTFPPPPTPPTSPFGAAGVAGPFPPGQGPATIPGGLAPSGTITGRLAAGGPISQGLLPAPPAPFGAPPPWTLQLMRSMYNAKAGGQPAPCSAPSGSNCQCVACTAAQFGLLGSWMCPICGTFERKATDHTWPICQAALPTIGPIGPDKPRKDGLVLRMLRRVFGS